MSTSALHVCPSTSNQVTGKAPFTDEETALALTCRPLMRFPAPYVGGLQRCGPAHRMSSSVVVDVWLSARLEPAEMQLPSPPLLPQQCAHR